MRKTETFHTDNTGFTRAMAFVQQFLTDCGLEKKARIKAKLVVEEILGSLMAHRRGDDMRISARSLLGTVTIELAVKGEPFSLTENMKSAELPKDDVIDADAQDVLRNIMLRSMTDDLKYRHRDGVNYTRQQQNHFPQRHGTCRTYTALPWPALNQISQRHSDRQPSPA